MPYYPSPNQGFLAPLIGAAVQYFQTKDQMQSEQQRRELEQQQMKIAAQQAATEQELAPSEIELAQAKADEAKAASQPFPGFPSGLQSAPADPQMPGYSPKETLQQRADGVHKYMAGLYGVKTFYEKRLDWLATLPQTPAVLGEMDSIKDHLTNVSTEVENQEKELDRIGEGVQRATDRRDLATQMNAEHLSTAEILKHIPQARITVNTGDRGAAWSRADADPDAVDYAETKISKSNNPMATAEGLVSTALEHGAKPRTIEAIKALGVRYQDKYAQYHKTKLYQGGETPP